jgi:hypothetical protein
MKSPPVQFTDDEAHNMVQAFIADTPKTGKPGEIPAKS